MKKLLIPVLCLLFLAACGSSTKEIDISTDTAENADFSSADLARITDGMMNSLQANGFFQQYKAANAAAKAGHAAREGAQERHRRAHQHETRPREDPHPHDQRGARAVRRRPGVRHGARSAQPPGVRPLRQREGRARSASSSEPSTCSGARSAISARSTGARTSTT